MVQDALQHFMKERKNFFSLDGVSLNEMISYAQHFTQLSKKIKINSWCNLIVVPMKIEVLLGCYSFII